MQKLMDSAKVVWNVPVVDEDQTVYVQVSRSDTAGGEWKAVSSQMYRNGENPELNLEQLLTENGLKLEECRCILFGGEPGIQTSLAVIVREDQVLGAISLSRDLTAYAASGPSEAPGTDGRAANEEQELEVAIGTILVCAIAALLIRLKKKKHNAIR